MKVHFVEAHARIDIKIPESVLRELPGRIILATDVQFIKNLDSLAAQLENAGKEVHKLKGAHAKHLSQILGCSHIKLDYPKFSDAFFYVGDGEFHPKALLLGGEKEVFTYNPFSKEFRRLPRSLVSGIRRKERGGLVKFLHSERVAVLVSVKPGQMGVQAHLKKIYGLEGKYPDKKFFYLVFDTLDFSQLENFPFVEVFVNTACTRLLDDIDKFPRPMVNIEQVLRL